MDTIFMNYGNYKLSDPRRQLLNFPGKIHLKRSEKYVALSNRSIYYTWENKKKLYKNNTFKVSPITWNDNIQLPNVSYYVSDIQDCFEYISKRHGEKTDNPSVRIFVNKRENRITFKIKTGYYPELLTPETMELLASTKNRITKDENGENISHLEITEVVLVHCNIVNNDYQQDSRILYTFIPNKLFWSIN